MPAAQLPRSQAVVAEQEVPDRMWLAYLCPPGVRGHETFDARGIFAGAGRPLLGIQLDVRTKHAVSRRAPSRPDPAPDPPAPPWPHRLRLDRGPTGGGCWCGASATAPRAPSAIGKPAAAAGLWPGRSRPAGRRPMTA